MNNECSIAHLSLLVKVHSGGMTIVCKPSFNYVMIFNLGRIITKRTMHFCKQVAILYCCTEHDLSPHLAY